MFETTHPSNERSRGRTARRTLERGALATITPGAVEAGYRFAAETSAIPIPASSHSFPITSSKSENCVTAPRYGDPTRPDDTRVAVRLRASVIVLVALVTVTTGIGAHRVDAGTSSGCGSVLIPAGQWLQGNGVDVYSNGAGSCSGGSAGFGFQCVDLAYRLYKKLGWGTVHAGGDGGAQNIPEGSQGLDFHANGTYRPIPGDLIIEYSTSANPSGHVAVVDSVEGNTIQAVEQNTQYLASGVWLDHPRHTYAIDASNNITLGYGTVRGTEHAPLNYPSGTRMMVANKWGISYRVNDSSAWIQINDATGMGSHPRVAVSGTRMLIANAYGSFYRVDDSSPWTQINDAAGVGADPQVAVG